jgi:hypothetical protein
VCGTKNFVSVRLYSAPQSHWTIVAIPRIWAYGEPVQAEFVRHNQTGPVPFAPAKAAREGLATARPVVFAASACASGSRKRGYLMV